MRVLAMRNGESKTRSLPSRRQTSSGQDAPFEQGPQHADLVRAEVAPAAEDVGHLRKDFAVGFGHLAVHDMQQVSGY
jgi:hypothetical protein